MDKLLARSLFPSEYNKKVRSDEGFRRLGRIGMYGLGVLVALGVMTAVVWSGSNRADSLHEAMLKSHDDEITQNTYPTDVTETTLAINGLKATLPDLNNTQTFETLP
jgi:hypothetical protein